MSWTGWTLAVAVHDDRTINVVFGITIIISPRVTGDIKFAVCPSVRLFIFKTAERIWLKFCIQRSILDAASRILVAVARGPPVENVQWRDIASVLHYPLVINLLAQLAESWCYFRIFSLVCNTWHLTIFFFIHKLQPQLEIRSTLQKLSFFTYVYFGILIRQVGNDMP